MKGKILNITEIICHHYILEFKAEEAALSAHPGQFIYVRITSGLDPLLRRPFSIANASPEEGVLTLLIRVVGRGTQLLSRYNKGYTLDFLGPLGSGFTWNDDDKNVLLVAGGIGIAPLLFLSHRLAAPNRKIKLFLGARTAQEVVGETLLHNKGIDVLVATEDGSRGYKGLVTDLLEKHLYQGSFPDRIFSCGPVPMLAKVVDISRNKGISVQISMEERMACGIGACLGCAVSVNDEKGGVQYLRVCREGPVFYGEKVIFHE